MSELNSQIKQRISANNIEGARQLLHDALPPQANAETYYLGSLVAVNDDQKRDFLFRALAMDPSHSQAHQALNMMNSGMNPNMPQSGYGQPPVPYQQNMPPVGYGQPPAPYQQQNMPYKYQPPIVGQVPTVNVYGRQDPLAGVVSRFLAMLIDGFILCITYFVIVFTLVIFVTPNYNLYSAYVSSLDTLNLVSLIIAFGLNIVFYVMIPSGMNSNGQTIGKRAMGIQVVNLSGAPMTFGSNFGRNIFGYFLSSFILGLGFFWALFDSNRQTWHDKLMNTVVIKLR